MPTGLERTVTGEQPRTLPVAATGTALSPAFTTPIATLTSTATSLSSGPEGQARILSSMSPGRAVGLLPAVWRGLSDRRAAIGPRSWNRGCGTCRRLACRLRWSSAALGAQDSGWHRGAYRDFRSIDPTRTSA